MAKRFTDTGKWDKAWFRKLNPTEKCVWMFLCDKCDHAGVWEVDLDALNFFVGTDWDLEKICSAFEEKVQLFADNKLLILGFTSFQYGSLNPENKVHKSAIDRLNKLKPIENKVLFEPNKLISIPNKGSEPNKVAPSKGLARGMHALQDTDTDKEKDKEPSKILFDAWNNNCGSLPKATRLTEKRKIHAKAQFKKYPDLTHWLSVLEKWRASDFCTRKWRPNFDDWLSEDKRTRAIEGRYDNSTTVVEREVFG